MNKTFLVKIGAEIHCGKCGNLLYPDANELAHHEKMDHVYFVNRQAYELEDIKAYSLSTQDRHLDLTILQADGDLSDFKGIIWNKIYTCSFYAGSRDYAETGTGTLKEWLEYLECDMLLDVGAHTDLNMSDEPDFITVSRIFHGVAYINSIADFIKMHLDKGFKNNLFDVSDIRRIKAIRPDYNLSFKNSNMKRLSFCQLKEEEIGNQVLMVACCMSGVIKEEKFVVESKANIYISKDYVYNPTKFDVFEFICDADYGINITYGRFRYEKFHKTYPELKLKEYIESGGTRYLNFLLASNNDRLLELIGKSELGYLSNILDRLTCINREGRNVKEVFGIPIKALKNLNSKEISENLTDADVGIIKEAYHFQPAILDEPMTATALTFIKANLGNTSNPIRLKLKPKMFLEYARYCRDLTEQEYNSFVDYSNMCIMTGLWPYKKFPEQKDIGVAHDVIMNYMNERRQAVKTAKSTELNEAFEKALLNEDYTNLIALPDTFFFGFSNYILLMPRTAEDLVEESYQMRNCVRSYVSSVAMGRTYILFLRKKSSKSKSFVTIEVTGNYRVAQVKGKGNAHPPCDVIEWVRKWADAKNLTYQDCYDLQDEYGMRRGYGMAI